jgi:hypothetical protein
MKSQLACLTSPLKVGISNFALQLLGKDQFSLSIIMYINGTLFVHS